jgi:hypothetical protein
MISAVRIARELWWTKREFSPVDIVPSWFSMFMHHLEVGHRERGWPQLRDVISTHQDDHDHV